MKKYLSLVSISVISCVIVLVFAGYGYEDKAATTFTTSWLLVRQTFLGINIPLNYYGINGIEILYSIRLVVFAIIIALLFGTILAVVRFRLTSAIKAIIEVPFALLEAVPEPIYVVLTVIVTLLFIEQLGISLPAFPQGYPSWMDTFIPAIALGLPGAFYLSRILELNLIDELHAQYATTAESKGLSKSQVFYRHVLSNVVPGFIKQITVICGMVLSSLLFAEFMLGYRGALNYYVQYGFLGTQKPRAVPMYEPGLTLMVGAFLVGLWLIFSLISYTAFNSRYRDVETTPAPLLVKVNVPWIAVGTLFILSVIACSVFPHLLTPHNPDHRYLIDWQTMQGSPFPPNHTFLFGTDYLGRDMLARTLQGTFDTLLPTVVAAILTTVISVFVSSLTTVNPRGWLSRLVNKVGSTMSALPILILLMLAMHHRDISSRYQEIVYCLWLVLFESGRGVYVFSQVFEQWYQYGFVEGATSIGRSRITILFTHFRKWLQRFTLEFMFVEIGRILSLMTMLAVFQIYPVERLQYAQFWDSGKLMILSSAQNTWFSMIGDATLNGAFMDQNWFLYGPVVFILLISVGSNLIARGLRGKVT